MATATLTTSVFPPGATVTAYPRANFPSYKPVEGAPVGSSTTSATMGTNGSVTFTGLALATDYVAYALVNSLHRYVQFRTGESNTRALKFPAGPPDFQFVSWDTWRMPNATRPTIAVVNLGVIAAEGQNGHCCIDVSSDPSSGTPTTHPTGITYGYHATRHEDNASATEANIGTAGTQTFFVPAGWSYRYRRETQNGFAAPTYSIGNSGITWEFAL